MKRQLLAILAVVALCAGRVQAGSQGAIIGTLMGAGAGLWLGHESGDIKTEVAVPVMAVAGGLLGHYLQDRRQDRHERRHAPASAAAPQINFNDPHPGIDLVKISVLLSNGTRVDIPVLRIGERFVGPQGEAYDALPSSETLRLRYAK